MACINFEDFERTYQLGKKIGQGTYGVVYEAIHTRTGEPYVVKKQAIRGDFIREVCILSQFTHPNIVNLEHVSIDHVSGMGLLAMPKGESVRDAYNGGKITVQQILTDLFAGLSFLNNNGIAHCDLKDANVIYDAKDDRVKIIDMGFARFGEYLQDEYTGNNAYYITGIGYTEIYRSPLYFPQHLNNINVELYSLAYTLYYLVYKNYERGLGRTYYVNLSTLRGFEWSPEPAVNEAIADFIYKCQQHDSYDDLAIHPALIENRINYQPWSKPNFGVDSYVVGEVLNNRPEHRTMKKEEFYGWIATLHNNILDFAITYMKRCNYSVIFLAFDLLYRFLQASRNILYSHIITDMLPKVCLFIASSFVIPSCANFGHELPDGLVKDTNFQALLCNVISTLEGKLYNYTLADQSQDIVDIFRSFFFMTNVGYQSGKTYLFDTDPEGNRINPANKFAPVINCEDFFKKLTQENILKKFAKYKHIDAVFEDDYCAELRIWKYHDILVRPGRLYNLPDEQTERDILLNADPADALDESKTREMVNKIVRYSLYFPVHTIDNHNSVNICKLLLDNYTQTSNRLTNEVGLDRILKNIEPGREIRNTELFKRIYFANIDMDRFYDYIALGNFGANYPFVINLLDVQIDQIYDAVEFSRIESEESERVEINPYPEENVITNPYSDVQSYEDFEFSGSPEDESIFKTAEANSSGKQLIEGFNNLDINPPSFFNSPGINEVEQKLTGDSMFET